MTDVRKTAPATHPTPSGATDSVVTECELTEAPDKVWKALTRPELLAAWLPEARACEILQAEPHRSLRYRWPSEKSVEGPTVESEVTFELSDTSNGGTHLRVIHRLTAVSAVARESKVVPFRRPRRGDTVAIALRWAA